MNVPTTLAQSYLSVPNSFYVWFIVFVLVCLSVDLIAVRHKDTDKVTSNSTLTPYIWTAFWAGLALAFNGWIWWKFGKEPAMTFLTGYLVEMSLSVDNLFVFILIFSSLKIEPKYQHRVLFWGILGALVMRAICIGVGVAILHRFKFVEFIFAAILIWAGLKTLLESLKPDDSTDEKDDPSKGLLARWVQKVFPVAFDHKGREFFIRREGVLSATPLFLALVLIEASDVIFAVDSIPAVLSITSDPFLVYTSNIFAILGLRSMYFMLAQLVSRFKYLSLGVSFILVFIGLKMTLGHWFKMPIDWALGIIVSTLALSVLASVVVAGSQTNQGD